MREVQLPSRWTDKVDAFAGTRRDAFFLVGIVVLVAVGTLIVWSRRAPASIAPPATGEVAIAPSPVATMLVHVAGRVRRPGLYRFAPGARVADAIAMAGGARRAGDLDLLNLAEMLQDGQKVEVGAAPASAAPGSTPAVTRVNINIADASALEAIPGIGPAKAAAIIEERSSRGGFAAVEDLLAVQGIGPATLEAIRPYVTL